MAELTVASTYAKALFDAASDNSKEERIGEEIKTIENILKKEPEFFELLKTPVISDCVKKQIVEELFYDFLCSETLCFLYILIDKKRISRFFQIVSRYDLMLNKKNNVSIGLIYSANALTSKQLDDFSEKVSILLNKKVKLNNITDTKIIGGVKIIIEGKIIDATVKKRLNDLHKEITRQ